MVTDFQARKLDREFDVLDADGSGVLEREDYLLLADRFLARYRVSPRSRRGRRVVEAFDRLWQRHLQDWDADGDRRLSREEYRRAIEHGVLRRNGFNEVHVPLIDAILALVDTQERGVLNRREFAGMMAVFGVPEADSALTFGDLDIDGDERLTRDELVRAFRLFYLSTDPQAPENRLFGWVY